MGLVRVELNRAGIEAVLRSRGVLDELRRRAELIARAADEGLTEPGFVVDTEIGPRRARAAVIARSIPARIAEARHRQLTRSVDAGRR